MANRSDITRDQWMLRGPLAKKGYDWWWHSLTAENAETGEEKPFYVEFFTCNPALAEDEPKLVWHLSDAQRGSQRPSYLMVNAGFWGEDHGQLHRFLHGKTSMFMQMRLMRSAPRTVTAAKHLPKAASSLLPRTLLHIRNG